MSLKYRDASGIETPVAGLNGTSGELVPSVSLYQTGQDLHTVTTIYAGDIRSYTVTFTTPMPDANYDISASPLRVESNISISAKTKNGFTYYIEAISSVSGNYGINWTAFKLMTDTVHEADSAHIAQNTANFAPAFSEVTSYAVGDYCTYSNVLYRCTTAHTAGTWVAGHFTQVTVGGDTASINSKIPSTASSTEKLAYVEYSPDADLYSTWEELLGLLYQHGAGYWTGSIYIGRWYTYTARITIASSGYWYGSFFAKSAENEDLVGASKPFSLTATWTVSHYVTEDALIVTAVGDNSTATGTNVASTWKIISNGSLCICYGVNTEAFNTTANNMVSMQLPSGYVFNNIISANIFVDGIVSWSIGTSHQSGNGAGTYITVSGTVLAGSFRQIAFAYKA